MPSHTPEKRAENRRKASKRGNKKFAVGGSLMQRIRRSIARTAPGGALIESANDRVKKALERGRKK